MNGTLSNIFHCGSYFLRLYVLATQVIRFSHNCFLTWDDDIAILALTSPIDIINVPTRSALPWVPGFFLRAQRACRNPLRQLTAKALRKMWLERNRKPGEKSLSQGRSALVLVTKDYFVSLVTNCNGCKQ